MKSFYRLDIPETTASMETCICFDVTTTTPLSTSSRAIEEREEIAEII